MLRKDNTRQKVEALLSRPLIEDYKELFKAKKFDFITVREGKKHEKQEKALYILTDDETEEFGYGGAAGGAKSWTGCSWLIFMCLCYPGTRWFIGREELTRLMASTYITFLKAAKEYGLVADKDFKYNGQYHYIQFTNGSRIDLLDLKFQPRDPYYERYGSTEYTGGWIEEGGEVNFGAYDTLKSRIGRCLNDFYGILGKLLVTLNPKKNWCHQVFWKPFKAGLLGKAIKFLQALVTDNPFVDSGYLNKLKGIKDKVRKQRLLEGNFDYDDDENALMDWDAINDLFTNSHVERGEKFLTVDVARFGKDESRIYLWDGWLVTKRWILKHKKTTEVAAKVREIADEEKVPMSRTIVDEDGVGGGVVDILGCKGFVNGSSPLENPKSKEKENYENLATQCSYMTSEMVNDRTIGFDKHFINDTEFVEKFIEEAEQVKKRDADDDRKLKVMKKEDIKEQIGRSPDDWDTFKMRQWFELKPRLSCVAR
jgi:phage terminase large subunit